MEQQNVELVIGALSKPLTVSHYYLQMLKENLKAHVVSEDYI